MKYRIGPVWARVGLGVIAVVVTAVIALVDATDARAATLDRPTFTRGASPAEPGYEWGVQVAQLPTCVDGNTGETVGGWSGRRQVSLRNVSGSASRFRPAVFSWGELCRSGGTTISALRAPSSWYALKVADGANQVFVSAAPSASIAGQTVTSAVKCAASEWSNNGTWRDASGVTGAGFGPNTSAAVETTGTALGWTWGSTSGCTYVVMARIVVCGYVWDEARSSSGVARCDSFVWSADAWYTGHRYNDLDQGRYLCEQGSNSAECVNLNPPDEWSWETVCEPGMPVWGPPPITIDNMAVWLPDLWGYSWDFTMQYTGHIARCLFVPPGGWDTSGSIEQAWGGSGFSNVAAVMEDAGTAFTITEACGVVLAATDVLGGFEIDTCTWTWGEPVKIFLAWTTSLAFAFWGVSFIVRTFLAAFRAVPMPSPFEMAETIHSTTAKVDD